MAARINKLTLHDKWREKIRTSMLINRLTNHVLGRINMSKTQVAAAAILLKKVLPDIAAIEHTGANGEPLTITRVYYSGDAAPLQLHTEALPAPDPEETGFRH